MGIPAFSWLRQVGIGGRLFLAFVLISSITLLASGLATQTYLDLSDRLALLKYQDIPGLDAAARLNDKNRLIVATAPLLVTAASNVERQQAMAALQGAIKDMDSLMRTLPDYNRYFVELITQIQNNLALLNQSVEKREQVRTELTRHSLTILPFFQTLIPRLNLLPHSEAQEIIEQSLYYFAGLIEKVSNDASFNELDYTFLRLEALGQQVEQQLHLIMPLPNAFKQDIDTLLALSSRQGHLFKLKNAELELLYQQSFFLENSQTHIQQLAAQINQYTNQTNASISHSLDNAIQLIKASIRNVLLLSLISLAVACAVSWFYVRRNVLERILALQKNMRAIASSQLDTDIQIIGDDEVASMARDLKHFQGTAIQVERTNQKLAAEVEERVAAEAQLKATQSELVQAGKLAALGQLSVGITHEINQPLTAVASHLHTARRHIEKNQLEQAHNSLQKIRLLLDKIAGITRHLKAFAREAGTELSPVLLNTVIEDTIELMTTSLRDHGCQLDYQMSPSLHANNLYVWAEPIRLEQVLVNLLSNAIDALSETPQRHIRMTVEQDNRWVNINIEDTGCGISTDSLKQIFDPFFTQKEVGKGLGLGLSISYNIIQDFAGQIRVTSQVGHGSCFTLALQHAE